jgi:hypothetical protein
MNHKRLNCLSDDLLNTYKGIVTLESKFQNTVFLVEFYNIGDY